MSEPFLKYSGLTDEILNSIESSVKLNYAREHLYYIKFKDVAILKTSGVRLFVNEGAAKSFINNLVKDIFWHGPYWQSCAKNIKKQRGLDVDFSGMLNLFSERPNLVAYYDSKEFKDVVKKLATDLIKSGVFKIEKL